MATSKGVWITTKYRHCFWTAFIWHVYLIDGKNCAKTKLLLFNTFVQKPVAKSECKPTPSHIKQWFIFTPFAQCQFSYGWFTESMSRAKFNSCLSSFRSDVWIVMVGSATSSKADFRLVLLLRDIVSGIIIAWFSRFIRLYLSVCPRVRRLTYHYYQNYFLIYLLM